MIQKLCKNCFTAFTAYSSIGNLCPRCAYNKYAKPRKPIKRIGKVTQKWIETRRDWIRDNPEPWLCYLCGVRLDTNSLTLDHVKSRSRHPELRFDHSNLQPCCASCNAEKGSKSLT